MNAKHTPGPWTLQPLTTEHGRLITGRAFDGSDKAIVMRVRGGTADQADANARLLAAAPDYWDAAEAMKDAIWMVGLDGFKYRAVLETHFDALMAAHAKVNGEGQ